MRAKRTLALGAATAVGIGLAGGGAWWKLSQGEGEGAVVATAPVDSPAVVVPPSPLSGVASSAPAMPAAPAPVAPVVVPAPEAMLPAVPSAPPVSAPLPDAPVAERGAVDSEVIYPTPEDVAAPVVLEDPQFVDEDPAGAFAPVASELAAIPGDVLADPDPNYAQLDEFVRVSLAVFAQNDAYDAAIARAHAQGHGDRETALRTEMAAEAQAIIVREFPWGLQRYVELARAVREDPALEEEAAFVMQEAVR